MKQKLLQFEAERPPMRADDLDHEAGCVRAARRGAPRTSQPTSLTAACRRTSGCAGRGSGCSRRRDHERAVVLLDPRKRPPPPRARRSVLKAILDRLGLPLTEPPRAPACLRGEKQGEMLQEGWGEEATQACPATWRVRPRCCRRCRPPSAPAACR